MKKFIVISHTHWDREWYMSFSSFRLKLVDLVDRLIDIIGKDNTYIFHLDAQTVVLEDYLELRPENRGILVKYITAGNIIVGPWYLQNDFYLTSGESTVRNLQIGTKIANEFGRCSEVGYAPDQFGNVTQMPQILKGFGIDNFVFGRGFNKFEGEGESRRAKVMPAEFNWVGADGTKALAVHLKFWYNNAQHIPEELELGKLLLNINARNFEGLNVSPYILLMNGVDHLEAQADVKDVIATLNDNGFDVKQTSLDEYVQGVKDAVAGKQIFEYKGALNMDHDNGLLKGCWSSRIYLKRENVRCEDLLINKLEPVYTYLESNGFNGAYPKNEMQYLWKSLLKNHPHDSICGCSIDCVHKHMEDSFEKITEMGEDLLSRALKVIALHTPHVYGDERNYSVTVFNPTEVVRSGVVEATINFSLKDNVGSFELYDKNGSKVPYEIVSRKDIPLDVFSPLNLPGILDVSSCTIRFYAEGVPAYSSVTYAAVADEGARPLTAKITTKVAENEYYSIYSENGSLVIENKTTGERNVDPLLLEDCVERGDSYVYRKGPDAPVMVKPCGFEIIGGLFKSTVRFAFEYDCPACYDFENVCKSAETVKERMECELILQKNNPAITLKYNVINKAKDHRVRLFINSSIVGGVIKTDSAFDYAQRQPFESCDITDSNTHHNATMLEVSGSGKALAVYTEGQHEVEYTDKYVAITLLRCFGAINRNPVTLKIMEGSAWGIKEGQCLRDVEGRLAFSYGASAEGAVLWSDAKFFRTGFLVHADSFDYKKYSGGRFAVQSSELEKLYYVPDKFLDCSISGEGVVAVEGEKVAITCVKRGICGGTVVRMVNLSDSEATVNVRIKGRIYQTELSEKDFVQIGENQVSITFKAKQIITIKAE